jgi:hypothetical protein
MKIYTVVEADYETILNIYSFKTRGDAEEFILSCVEQESLNTYNYLISIYTEENVLTEWKRLASKYNKTLEGYMLYKGGYNLNGIYESELN